MKHKPLTKVLARRAMRWFQEAMGIQDWRIRLWITNEPPYWASEDCGPGVGGKANSLVEWKEGKIWVSNSRCLDCEENPLATLFHEGMHIVANDAGISEDTLSQVEFVWNRLGAIMAGAYRSGKDAKKGQ